MIATGVMVASSLEIGVAFIDKKDCAPFGGPAELVVEVMIGVEVFAGRAVFPCWFFLSKFELEEGSMDAFGHFG